MICNIIGMSKYRKDARSEDEFKDDIAECTRIESQLMSIYVNDLGRRTNKKYTFADNGIDNSGEYHADNKITSDADFILYTPEKKSHLIEIKFSRPDCSRFHLKVSQIKSYIKQDCCIIMFMGIDTEQSRYTIITPKDMINIQNTAEEISLWYKQVYRLKTKDFIWYPVSMK